MVWLDHSRFPIQAAQAGPGGHNRLRDLRRDVPQNKGIEQKYRQKEIIEIKHNNITKFNIQF